VPGRDPGRVEQLLRGTGGGQPPDGQVFDVQRGYFRVGQGLQDRGADASLG
jgi:hypothetical protein